MEVINLNLIPTGALPVVHASQYDDGRTFRANLMDGSAVYTLDGTEVLECDVKKPDGNIVTVAVTNTSDSYVEIDTTLQMCACAGESLAELHITKGAKEIGTLNFILAVERSPMENGIQSDSGIHNLSSQVSAMVATEVADQYDSANVIFDNAPTAGHGNGYAVTSDGLKTAIDAKEDAADVGALTDLTTADQTSIVNAINEVDGEVGDLSTLTTTATSDLVSAVNELDGDIGDLSALTTSDTDSLVDAVNEVVGDVADLQTNKSNTLMVSTTALSISYGGARYKSENFDVSRTGYSVLGVVGYSLSSIDNIVYSCHMTSTNTLTVGIQTRDASSSTATISGYVDVLYVKNS